MAIRLRSFGPLLLDASRQLDVARLDGGLMAGPFEIQATMLAPKGVVTSCGWAKRGKGGSPDHKHGKRQDGDQNGWRSSRMDRHEGGAPLAPLNGQLVTGRTGHEKAPRSHSTPVAECHKRPISARPFERSKGVRMKKTVILIAAISACTLVLAKGGGSHSGGSSSRGSSSSHSYSGSHSGSSSGSHSVQGYTRKDGTYVAPHHATNRDDTKNNNWTTQGNVNPHTGKPGTKPGD
jgi:hypothetical protein